MSRWIHPEPARFNGGAVNSYIFYAHDDHAVNHQNEKRFYAALKRNGIAAKLIEFKHGGHGFGLGLKGTDSTGWPKDCAAWLKKERFLPVR